MGVHSAGPSKTKVKGKSVLLSELTELPFLFKFLAAGKALSIQAHPNLPQAREGFAEETRRGIALSAPERNYRDPNHKPEILCPLSPFTAMAGFREPGQTEELLALVKGTKNLRAALKTGYRDFLFALFNTGPGERQELNAAVLEAADKPPPGDRGGALALCGEFARDFPGDPGILSPLYLNLLELEPFQGIFISPGILHAYVRGFAVECMANSDNVLRGGLTPKHVDMAGLFRILSWDPFTPELLTPEPLAPEPPRDRGPGSPGPLPPGVYGYKSPCKEFSLFLVRGPGAELEAPGNAIVAIIEGRAELAGCAGLEQGESAFIPRRGAGEKLSVQGDCSLFAALVPE
jgi:mannose-6-phosphate isomerase